MMSHGSTATRCLGVRRRRATRTAAFLDRGASRLRTAQLRKLPDGSIRSTASVGELPTYTVTAETPLAEITGVKLEALPDRASRVRSRPC
jgi:hypothetical protein